MNYYKLYGNIIETDLVFPQLVPCDPAPAESMDTILVVAGTMPDSIIERAAKLAYDFGPTCSYLTNRTCYLLVEDGKRILYQAKENANEIYLKTYILGFGMSMLFHQRGSLSIHCSAVSNENGALLICGESGCGKSTITTHLLENGYTLMADDMAILTKNKEGKAMVLPAFPFQKLCRNVVLEQNLNLDELIYINEEKDKFLVPYQGEFSCDARLLRGIIVLSLLPQECDVTCQQMSGINMFHAYTENLFLRHLLAEKKYQVPTGPLCLSYAGSAPVWMLSRPVGKDTLAEVLKNIDTILHAL